MRIARFGVGKILRCGGFHRGKGGLSVFARPRRIGEHGRVHLAKYRFKGALAATRRDQAEKNQHRQRGEQPRGRRNRIVSSASRLKLPRKKIGPTAL